MKQSKTHLLEVFQWKFWNFPISGFSISCLTCHQVAESRSFRDLVTAARQEPAKVAFLWAADG